MRDAWTDERLDDLNRRVDVGFADLRTEIRDLRAEMNELRREMSSRFEAVDARLDAMQRTMVHGFVAMAATIVAALGIATQL